MHGPLRWRLNAAVALFALSAAALESAASASPRAAGATRPAIARLHRVQSASGGPQLIDYMPVGGLGEPAVLIAGAGRTYWFTYDDFGGHVGRIDAHGAVKLFAVPGSLGGLALGPNGNVWATVQMVEQPAIAQIRKNGAATYYPINGMNYPARPTGIAAGPDGNIWFCMDQGNAVGSITPKGTISLHPLPTPGSPIDIVAGAEGALWTTVSGAYGTPARIDRVETSGRITEYPLPANEVSGVPGSIVAGPNDSLWFTGVGSVGSQTQDFVGLVTLNGNIATFPTPTPNAGIQAITLAADGKLWFTETRAGQLGSTDPNTGAISEWLIPGPPGSGGFAQPYGIAPGPKGSRRVWVADQNPYIGIFSL